VVVGSCLPPLKGELNARQNSGLDAEPEKGSILVRSPLMHAQMQLNENKGEDRKKKKKQQLKNKENKSKHMTCLHPLLTKPM
jgi:hypothetical protein